MDGWSEWRRCPLCSQQASSAQALVDHLDKRHPEWVQEFMARQGFAVPRNYPVRKFRVALAALLASEARQAPSN